MRINEIDDRPGEPLKLKFDPCDDAVTFMRNDPMFYRRKYYPALMQLKDDVKKKKRIDAEKIFGGVIDSGMNTYCKKFKLGKTPSQLFSMEDRTRMMEKVCSEEIENIKKGEY